MFFRRFVLLAAALVACACCSCRTITAPTHLAAPPATATAPMAAAPVAAVPVVYVPHAGPQHVLMPQHAAVCPPASAAPSANYAWLPPSAYTDPGRTPWHPPYLGERWPRDEYLFDGGDKPVEVKIGYDWSVRGIDPEDTVVHFDTLDGRTLVEPSNRVAIYAPRFAAVRQVSGLFQNEQAEHLARTRKGIDLQHVDETLIAGAVSQPIEPGKQISTRNPTVFLDTTKGAGLDNAQKATGYVNGFAPYENFEIIRTGRFDTTEKLRLAKQTQAALNWSADQAVQVVIDGKPAHEAKGRSKAEETVRYEMPPGKPRLRVVKVASKQNALPGEEVEFTIRFDNIGDQPVGNVTVVDNLTTRLEYVDGSQTCSVKHRFVTVENDQQSAVLRWEIDEPLLLNEGGLIRFRCRVR